LSVHTAWGNVWEARGFLDPTSSQKILELAVEYSWWSKQCREIGMDGRNKRKVL
jgi:hypothetical protein